MQSKFTYIYFEAWILIQNVIQNEFEIIGEIASLFNIYHFLIYIIL